MHMPECPYCRESVEGNDLFCRSCGASLKLPEYDRAFCPHCGARVSARQEFCHECHWSLVKPPAEEPASGPPPAPAKASAWKNPWVWGLLGGAGLLIVLLPWLFLFQSTPPHAPVSPSPIVAAPRGVPAAPVPVPAPAAPPAPEKGVPPLSATPANAAVLKDQLSELLNQLREAQLKKDISLYSQTFSPTFPDFDQRRQRTLAVWDAYDYSGLDFELMEVNLLDADQAQAAVTWKLEIRQKATQTNKSETQSYNVRFSKDGGKWRISNLERKPG